MDIAKFNERHNQYFGGRKFRPFRMKFLGGMFTVFAAVEFMTLDSMYPLVWKVHKVRSVDKVESTSCHPGAPITMTLSPAVKHVPERKSDPEAAGRSACTALLNDIVLCRSLTAL